MIDPQDIANELIAAEREHKAIGQFSDNYPDFDLETAYRAQRAFVQSWLDAGDRFVGYKLGLTSRNKQQAMGVDAPLYGYGFWCNAWRGTRAGSSFRRHRARRGVLDRAPPHAGRGRPRHGDRTSGDEDTDYSRLDGLALAGGDLFTAAAKM